MNPLQTLTQYLSNRAARKAEREEARLEAAMRQRLDEFVEQTASFAASALAKHGAAERRREAQARQDATTRALETGGTIPLQRMPYAPLRERVHG